MLQVSFDRRDEFRQFVRTLLEQHVDIRPRFLDVVAQLHETVVDADAVADDGDRHQEHGEHDDDQYP